MTKQLDPDFRIRAVRPSYSPGAAKRMPNLAPVTRNTRQPGHHRKHKHRLLIGGIVAVIILSLLTVNVFRNRGDKSTEVNAEGSSAQNAQVAGATTTTPPKQIDSAVLSAKVQQVLNTYSGLDTGVSVVGISDDTVHDYGDNAAYYAASVSKLIAASDFLSQVEKHTYTLNTTIAGNTAKNQLENLIVNSDNTAWQGFINLLGHPELERFAKANGVTFDADKNTLTPHDTTVLLKHLYQNQLLNKTDTKLLLSYMSRASSGQYLEANAPKGTTVYQKAGWLSDRLHVAGIVYDGNNGYIVAIFSKVNGSYDFTVGTKLIMQIQGVLNGAYLPS